MRIAALRHLATTGNLQQQLQGSRDVAIVPPDAATRQTIARQRSELAALGPFQRVLASDLQRTQQTAQWYGYHTPQIEPLMRELNFGEFEGGPVQRLSTHFGAAWHDDPRLLVLGESMADFAARIESVLAACRSADSVLLFGHGAWIRGLMSLLQHGDIRAMNRLELPNNHYVLLQA